MRQVLPIAFLALLAGCSGGGATDAGPPAVDSGFVDCTTDPRVSAYTPGLSIRDSSGDRKYVLMQSVPEPPARGTNIWTVQVTDGSGTALPSLSLGAAAFMPDHGHGSDVIPQVTSNGDGTYSVTPLYFFMPGVWRVTLSDADGGAGAGQFFFCVEG